MARSARTERLVQLQRQFAKLAERFDGADFKAREAIVREAAYLTEVMLQVLDYRDDPAVHEGAWESPATGSR